MLSAPGTKRSGIRYTYVLTDGQYIESHGNSMISSLSTHTLNILISSRSSYIYKKMSRRSSSSSASSDFVRRLRVIYVLPDIDIFTNLMATNNLMFKYILIYIKYILSICCVYIVNMSIYTYIGVYTPYEVCARNGCEMCTYPETVYIPCIY